MPRTHEAKQGGREHGRAAASRHDGSQGARGASRPAPGLAATFPHFSAIQRSFGRHDVSSAEAHVGRDSGAAAAARALGARAFTFGDRVAFAGAPDLATAAHEAAHVVQQRAGLHAPGGVGRPGDEHERHADQVAARVVRGASAEDLLDRYRPAPGAAEPILQRAITLTYPSNTSYGDVETLWTTVVRPYLAKHGWSVRGRRRALEGYFAGGDKTHADAADLVDFLRGAAPIQKEGGRGRPGWDDFWQSVHPPFGSDRRHIVLSSLMRNALYQVTDTNPAADVLTIYNALAGIDFKTVSQAEQHLASRMHNNRFNIYLGPSGWNQMAGGVAHKLDEINDRYQHIIDELWSGFDSESAAAEALGHATRAMYDWFSELTKSAVFGWTTHLAYLGKVVADRIGWACEQARTAPDVFHALHAVLSAFSIIITDSLKSAATDPSQASDEDYRWLQNNQLVGFNDRFQGILGLEGTDALMAFADVYRDFMALEDHASSKPDELRKRLVHTKAETFQPSSSSLPQSLAAVSMATSGVFPSSAPFPPPQPTTASPMILSPSPPPPTVAVAFPPPQFQQPFHPPPMQVVPDEESHQNVDMT